MTRLQLRYLAGLALVFVGLQVLGAAFDDALAVARAAGSEPPAKPEVPETPTPRDPAGSVDLSGPDLLARGLGLHVDDEMRRRP